MRVYSVYKNLDITYGELDKAMKILGFERKISRTTEGWKEEFLGRELYFTKYFTPIDDWYFLMSHQEADVLVPKHEIVSLSKQLEDFGYTNDYDDLAKMIEKNREPKLKRA